MLYLPGLRRRPQDKSGCHGEFPFSLPSIHDLDAIGCIQPAGALFVRAGG
jgi:hypothetical protein